MDESFDNGVRDVFNQGFEFIWKAFKETRAGKKTQQVKYVAKFFFFAGIKFILAGQKGER